MGGDIHRLKRQPSTILPAACNYAKIHAMSTLTEPLPPDPKDLRPLIEQQLGDATPAELEFVHRMLVELEARRLLAELDDATELAWESGRISDEIIARAVLEHRAASSTP